MRLRLTKNIHQIREVRALRKKLNKKLRNIYLELNVFIYIIFKKKIFFYFEIKKKKFR